MRLSSRLGFGEMFDPEPGELVVPCGPGPVGGLEGLDGSLGQAQLDPRDTFSGICHGRGGFLRLSGDVCRRGQRRFRALLDGERLALMLSSSPSPLERTLSTKSVGLWRGRPDRSTPDSSHEIKLETIRGTPRSRSPMPYRTNPLIHGNYRHVQERRDKARSTRWV